jgi:hypothetical protein
VTASAAVDLLPSSVIPFSREKPDAIYSAYKCK